jgi:hypothetical protein
VEEVKLQQPMSKDSGKKFLQEFFEEKPICSVIPQCPRLKTKAMMN